MRHELIPKQFVHLLHRSGFRFREEEDVASRSKDIKGKKEAKNLNHKFESAIEAHWAKRKFKHQFVNVEMLLPLAGISIGKISAGYTHDMMAVKVKNKEKTKFMATTARRALLSEVWAPDFTT